MFQHDGEGGNLEIAKFLILTTVLMGITSKAPAADDKQPVYDQIPKNHEANIKRLQDWIKLPSIAAENLNSKEGCDRMMQLAKDAGFQKVEQVNTDGKPHSTQAHSEPSVFTLCTT